MKHILLLSSARLNGTIVLRSFGQLENVVISNEFTTYMNFEDAKGYHAWDFHHDGHFRNVQQLVEMAKDASSRGLILVEHTMAGDLNDAELDLLRTEFVIVAVV